MLIVSMIDLPVITPAVSHSSTYYILRSRWLHITVIVYLREVLQSRVMYKIYVNVVDRVSYIVYRISCIVYRISYITIHTRSIRKIYDTTYTILRRFVVYEYIIGVHTYSIYYVWCFDLLIKRVVMIYVIMFSKILQFFKMTLSN